MGTKSENSWQTLRSNWKTCSSSKDRERLLLLKWIQNQRSRIQGKGRTTDEIKERNESRFQTLMKNLQSELKFKDLSVIFTDETERTHIINYLKTKKIPRNWYICKQPTKEGFGLDLKTKDVTSFFWDIPFKNRTLLPALETT